MKKRKILVADDEERICHLLEEFLSEEGFEVVTVKNGLDAIAEFSRGDYSLIILDVMMPEMDGWRTLSEIRKLSNLPVIMLTAKSDECDQLNSFEKGANDFISKPFSLAVLLARIQIHLKAAEKSSGQRMSAGKLEVDFRNYEVTVGEENINLSPIEYKLLTILMQNKGKIFSREELLDLVWRNEEGLSLRTVDTYVGRLRDKLGNGKDIIKTIRNYGYRIDPDNGIN